VRKPRAPPSTVPIPHDAADELHFDDFLFDLGAGAHTPAPLLDHGSNVILLGKAYFHVMREQVTAIDLQAKTRRAAKKTPFRLSTDLAHSMDMWYVVHVAHAHQRALSGYRCAQANVPVSGIQRCLVLTFSGLVLPLHGHHRLGYVW
jgi:hypothetical protein